MIRRSLWLFALVVLTCLPGSAHADRTQVFSITDAACNEVEEEMGPYFKKHAGIKAWHFDLQKFELTVTVADNVTDDEILKLFKEQGCYHAVAGAGQGRKAYTHEPYPDGADVSILTEKGDAVGSLDKLRVGGKYTVFDFYADWCGPCRLVDKQLRDITGTRKDVAVRKLNVVGFESPLAKQMGRKLKALPYVVVYAPDGKKTEITGHNPDKLADALNIKE